MDLVRLRLKATHPDSGGFIHTAITSLYSASLPYHTAPYLPPPVILGFFNFFSFSLFSSYFHDHQNVSPTFVLTGDIATLTFFRHYIHEHL